MDQRGSNPDGQQSSQAKVNSSMRLLANAMRITLGKVPPRDSQLLLDEPVIALSKDAVWFETPSGVKFHYRTGKRVVVESGANSDRREISLYLEGTALGAIAWLNRLVPLHASVVRIGQRLVAFTGPSGAGKSSIAAALSARGYPVMADDTVVLVPTGEGIFALPGSAAAKLTLEFANAIGLKTAEAVDADSGKFYTPLPNREIKPGLLTDLIFLAEWQAVSISEVEGSGKAEFIAAALYRSFIHVALADHEFHSGFMLEMASSLKVWTLQRPVERAEMLKSMNKSIAAIESNF